MQFPPLTHYFIPPRSKYSPQDPVLKHSHSYVPLVLSEVRESQAKL
jgi:hypothetical protein